MFAQERFQTIIDLLSQQQKMTVLALQEALGVSPATLRRDLVELEAAAKVIRVRGAVVHPNYFRSEPTFAQRSRMSAAVKHCLAEAAANLVAPGSTVLLDAGSTCLELGRILMARPDLTLITHSLPLALETHNGSAKVICIGGEVRSISSAAVGAMALSWLQNLRADWCFLGASGLSASEGASTTELSEAAIKQEFLRRAPQHALIADGSKWEQPLTVRFAAWKEFDVWVTDVGVSEETAALVSNQGPRVVRAGGEVGAGGRRRR